MKMQLKDAKTSVLGLCGAFIAVFTLMSHFLQGQPMDIGTLTSTLNQLVLALGLHVAADSTTPLTPTK